VEELVVSIEGETVTTLTYTDEETVKQLIQALKKQGIEPTEVKHIPCG